MGIQNYPATSIVIATLNNREGLGKVLRGMLELDYPNGYEVIVVDDGSTDGTGKMLDKEFSRAPKIKIIHLPRSGACRARNAGIRLAKGEISKKEYEELKKEIIK